MLSNIGVIGHILGVYRDNGKEHGSYYSILGSYSDNGFKGFWGTAHAKKNFIWVSATVGSGFRAWGRDELYAIPCRGEGFIISFAGHFHMELMHRRFTEEDLQDSTALLGRALLLKPRNALQVTPKP